MYHLIEAEGKMEIIQRKDYLLSFYPIISPVSWNSSHTRKIWRDWSGSRRATLTQIWVKGHLGQNLAGLFWYFPGFIWADLWSDCMKTDEDLSETLLEVLGWNWGKTSPRVIWKPGCCLAARQGIPLENSWWHLYQPWRSTSKTCHKGNLSDAGRWIGWPARLFPSLTRDDFMKALCQLLTNYCVLSSDQPCQIAVWEVRFSYKFLSESLWNPKIE